MSRERVIIGLGAAYVAEHPEQDEPAGAAAGVALSAARLGQAGMCVTRLGQDRVGTECVERLRAAGVDVGHVQSDPDLPTGRVFAHDVPSLWTPDLDEPLAFDNLQWDTDLSAAADQADAVVFSAMAVRNAQALSVVERFLEECPRRARRMVDLTERPRTGMERSVLRRALAAAEAAVVDDESLSTLRPAAHPSADVDTRLESARREFGLTHLVHIDLEPAGFRIRLSTGDLTTGADGTLPWTARWAALTTIVYGVVWGWDASRCVEVSRRVALFVAEHRREPVPAALLEAADSG